MNGFSAYFNKKTVGQIIIFCPLFMLPIQKAASQAYFQQEVKYVIQVSLNDVSHELNAFESVEYVNHSPDTLKCLYFHLWPNAYSDNQTPLAKQLTEMKGKSRLFHDPNLRGWIDSLDFKVNNEPVQWALLPNQPDICKLTLNDPLRPRDSISVTTPFHVKLPKGVTSRLGHLGESYQISQWYPKPAVYDRNGWHPISYLDQGEFYSEFGSYDVSITLPANYVIGATGNLQNESEKAWMDALAADSSWKVAMDTAGYQFPPSSKQTKTLRFTENRIHDFAWFADKRFHVLKGSVKLPESGKEITTWILFTNKQIKLWKDAIPYVNKAVSSFSKWVGAYPYSSFTAVQSTLNAGIGMEYPGITVIGWVEDGFALDKVIAHELAHSWFYSALGSDERRYPFMDEGITSSFEMRYSAECYPTKKLWELFFSNPKMGRLFSENLPATRVYELQWLEAARNNTEQPLDLTSTDYDFSNYGMMIYDKAGIGFNYLRSYLGDSLFDSCMQSYYRIWKFRHPQPDDLRKVFASETGKDLDWFFVDFIHTTKQLDYKMVRLKGQKVLVQNTGELKAPLVLSGMKRDSMYFEQWVDGFEGKKWIDLPVGDYTRVKIDPLHQMPEYNRLNNNIRRLGISPTGDPIHPQFLFSFEDPDKRNLIYIPALNWNREDGFMVGAVLHNGYILPKKLDYILMPFYSFHRSELKGYGKVSYNITPFETIIRRATLSLEGSQFGGPGNQNYHQARLGLELIFRPAIAKSPLSQKAFVNYITASDLSQILLSNKAEMVDFLQFGYALENTSLVNPHRLQATFEGNGTYQKIAAELNYRFSYYGKDKGLDVRLFAGGMLKSNAIDPYYSLAPSGRSGRELYFYQGESPDRFGVFPTSFWTREMTVLEGGLVTPLNEQLGYSQWMVSMSISSDLPGMISSIGVKPFVNLLLNDHGMASGSGSPLFFEAGLKTGIGDFFEISVPLIVSGNIQSMTGSIKDRIRFTFNLGKLGNMKSNLAALGL